MEIAALATRQHGVLAHRQLEGLGVTRYAIQHRLRAGRLHRLYRGVYSVGHERLTVPARWMAAVLACGPDALLSHRSAGALWGIRPSARSVTDITAPGRSRRRRAGLALHLVRGLDPEDRTTEDGIPVTTLARTLLDLAEVVPPNDLARAIEASEQLRLFDLRAVEDVIARSPGRRGLRALGRALETYRPAAITRSELERRFLDLCTHAGLPRPAVNVMVAGLEVDAVWHHARLVVELDSRTFHDTNEAFERDRIRDATLQLAGYRVLRLTYRRLVSEPEAVVRALRLLLGRRRGDC